jgi:hypothetical protein
VLDEVLATRREVVMELSLRVVAEGREAPAVIGAVERRQLAASVCVRFEWANYGIPSP